MANEFKVKKGLIVDGSNTVLDVQGTQGQLFSVTDSLTGDLFSVSDVSGIPILNVSSSGVSYFDGNVGIGTDSPQNLLHLKSTISGPTGIIIENTNNAQSLDIDFWSNVGAAQARIRYNEGAGSFDFFPNVGVGSAVTMLYGGNVGIANTSPTYRLVLGNAGGLSDSIKIGTYAVAKDTRQYIGYSRADSGLFESSGNGDTPSTVLAGVAGIRIVNTAGTALSSAADNSVQLLTHIYNGSSRVALHANYDGKVGIGTTSPDGLLHIHQTGSGTSNTIITEDDARKIFIGRDSIKATDLSNNAQILHLQQPGGNVVFGGNVGIGTTGPVNKIQANYAPVAIASLTANAGTSSTNWNRNAFLMGTGASISNALAFGVSGTANDRKTWIQSGHPDSAANSLGTISLNPLGGNVGIGVTDPNSKLTIETEAGDGTIELLAVNAATTKNKIIFSEAIQGDESFFIEHDGAGAGADNLLKIHGDGSGGTASGITIRRSGLVGIGTDSPSYKLDVSGDFRVKEGSSAIAFNEYNNGATIWLDGSNGDFTGGDYFNISAYGATDLVFGYAASTKMVLKSSGNLGIGVTDPSYKLEVSSPNNSVLKLINTEANYNANQQSILFQGRWYDQNPTQLTNTARIAGTHYANGYHSGGLNFYTYSNAVELNAMTMQYDGNVGIGTSTPSHKLEIGLTSSVALAAQPAIPLLVSNDGQSVDGRVFIQVKNDVVNGASAIGAGLQMTAAGVTSGTASYENSLIFLQSKSPGNQTIHSAPQNIKFYVDNDGTQAGAGASYNDFGDLAFELQADGEAIFYQNVGVGNTGPSYKLDVSGTIRATGDVIAYSDERVKENIQTIDNSLEKVIKLRGVEFNKIGEDVKSIGVIAQEIEKVIPEVVREDEKGMKSVAYGNITGLLIEAIKDLKQEVDKLKKQIENGNNL